MKGPATGVVGRSGLERGMKCAATRCGEARRRRTYFLLRIRSILPLYPPLLPNFLSSSFSLFLSLPPTRNYFYSAPSSTSLLPSSFYSSGSSVFPFSTRPVFRSLSIPLLPSLSLSPPATQTTAVQSSVGPCTEQFTSWLVRTDTAPPRSFAELRVHRVPASSTRRTRARKDRRE